MIRNDVIRSSLWWGDIGNLELGVKETSNEFSVKQTYKKIMSGSVVIPDPSWVKVRHKSVPSKVSCFVWRMFQNRVATKDNFLKRGIIDQGSTQRIGECGAEESIAHLFFECMMFGGTWYVIWNFYIFSK